MYYSHDLHKMNVLWHDVCPSVGKPNPKLWSVSLRRSLSPSAWDVDIPCLSAIQSGARDGQSPFRQTSGITEQQAICLANFSVDQQKLIFSYKPELANHTHTHQKVNLVTSKTNVHKLFSFYLISQKFILLNLLLKGAKNDFNVLFTFVCKDIK